MVKATLLAALVVGGCDISATVWGNVSETHETVPCGEQYQNYGESIERYPKAAADIMNHIDPQIEEKCGVKAVLWTKYGNLVKRPQIER
ncbi:hypothetical protein AB0M39_12505 [Streptomyces sp. NPDC051907]|uniref:hypothetical protein n=1 Tax=Streptomyces sp. NPDC051907 TaxID=3155284 RepID=UPI00342E62AF